jgi:pimeloyl-ACP methyl ester carboxylesterase
MQPFTVAIDQGKLDRIRRRVEEFAFPREADAEPWALGTDAQFLRRLREYWLTSYDWRAAERELNRFPQFKADVDGLEMHFIHEKGSGPDPMPLLLIHGWPGSTYEFHKLIEPLAHPARFGHDPSLSFDVVVASLPGYGFSGTPRPLVGPRRTGAKMDALMTRVLGYDRYFTQGGDWGCLICGWIGLDFPRSNVATHLNMIGMAPGGDAQGLMGSAALAPSTPEEMAWARDTAAKMAVEGGYIAQQSTRPQTLGYGLNDSPMGVAAWIIEKFHAWSDLEGTSLEQVFGFDLLLTNIMIYLVTDSFNTSTWMYRGAAEEGVTLPPGQRIEIPVALAHFPRDIISNPPRSYVDKAYNIARWTEFSRGGHFAALEAGDQLLDDVRAFFPTVRDRLKG